MNMQQKNDSIIDGQFLANTIHELRTPIQTISGSLELLTETKLTSDQIDYVQQMRFSADVLLTLVNDLLDFSKINSGKFSVEKITINPIEITEQISELLSLEAHSRNLEIITDIDYTLSTHILGDPTRIKQVLLNLIKNAIKFTPSGYVFIKLSQRLNNSILLFEVYDSGIGIKKDRQKKIFSDFYQVDASTTRKYGGTGLGLSISKSLVTAMGGKIGMKSHLNKGSLFWFSLPLEISEHAFPRTIIEEKIKLVSQFDIPEDTSILIVDSQILSLKSLYSKLKTLKLGNIDSSSSGKKALLKMKKKAEQHAAYSIVFIDAQITDMDVWELAGEIRKNQQLQNTKCFLMVREGQATSSIKSNIIKYFENYIYKPIKLSSLTSLLANYFNVPSHFGIIDSLEELPNAYLENNHGEVLRIEDKTVLVAEDHPINQKLMQTFLHQFGAQVVTASNGQDAVNEISNNGDIDIVFMDIQMPIKSGLEASKEIRKKGYTGIIIACTAINDISEVNIFKSHGMDDVLTKPFKRKDVGILLSKYLTSNKERANNNASASSAIKTLLGKTETTDFWDWKDFMDTVGGDIALGKELINQYTSQTQNFLNLAQEALKEKDFVSLVSIGHTLKGSSATLSLENLARIGSVIERAAKNKDIQTIRMALKTFTEIFTNFILFVAPEH